MRLRSSRLVRGPTRSKNLITCGTETWEKFGRKKIVYRSVTKYATEQVQTGTNRVTHMEAQKRIKKTKYNGEVVFTPWETLRAWTV
jgi:hypothetical protein